MTHVIGLLPIEVFAIISLFVLILYFKKIDDNKIDIKSEEFFGKKHVDWMEGIEFEKYLERLFLALDFKVTRTPGSGDMGADLILESESKRIAVEAKRYSSNVTPIAVRSLKGGMDYHHANEGWVITNWGFTEKAEKQAKASGIKLIDGGGLKKLQRDAYRNLTRKEQRPKKGLEKLWSSQGITGLSVVTVMLVIISITTNHN